MNGEQFYRNVMHLMKSNQVNGEKNRYTRPAPTTYEQQWLWDSCFHAIINSHIDPAMAKDELQSLLYHRGVDLGGMIPHMIYWNGGGERLWGKEYVSSITQPPIVARAALQVYKQIDDKDFLQRVYDPLRKYYNWLFANRDDDHDYLISIVHPWESGWDASPRWDTALGIINPTHDEIRHARIELAARLKEHNHRKPLSLWKEFLIEPVDVNALYSDSLFCLAEIARELGQADDASYYTNIQSQVNEAMNAKMWDAEAGYYWDLMGDHETWIKVPSSASFITLIAGVPSAEQAKRLVDQLLAHFWTNYPVPTTPIDDPTFRPEQYWRGNTWLNINWLIIKGLQRYGFLALANVIFERSLALTENSGFREYYHPVTGEGLGADSQSWSGIMIDLMNDPQFVNETS